MKSLMASILLVSVLPVFAAMVGDSVPDLGVPSTDGTQTSLSGYSGKWVVLYFYPRSFTPGCTRQACDMRDHYGSLDHEDVVVLGASVDDLETQERFKSEHKLPFELLSDADHELSEAFGVLSGGGKASKRVTFLIDPEGKVSHVMNNVAPDTHAFEIRKVLEEARQAFRVKKLNEAAGD